MSKQKKKLIKQKKNKENLPKDEEYIEIFEDNELISSSQTLHNINFWKVLLVDDDPDVHRATQLALKHFSFEGKKIDFLSAYSGKKARKIIKKHDDIAVILLDVVMETNHAGLEVVKYIREELNNRLTRILIRTGNPGEAPENSIILDYDIDNYTTKTELTQQHLITILISALRSYRDVLELEKSRQNLRILNQNLEEIIIQKTRDLEHKNQQLIQEIEERKKVEKSFFLLNKELENTVEERTLKLQTLNQALAQEIEERKQTEIALRESEKKFRLLVETIHEIFWIVEFELSDPSQLQISYVSSIYEKIWGQSSEVLYQNPWQWLKSIHPEDRERVRKSFQKCLLSGGYHEEYRVFHLDGSIRWIRARGYSVIDSSSPLGRMVGIAEDITSQKETEAILRRQGLILESISDGVIVTNLEGTIIEWNSGAEKIFGYSKAEVFGKNPDILYLPTQSSNFTQQIIDEMLDQGSWSGEIVFIAKDGTQGICETIVVPLKNEQGNLVATVGVNRDITARKRTEEQLQMTSERLRYLITSSPGVIYTCKVSGDYETTFVTNNVKQVFGYHAQDFLQEAQFWIDRIHPEDRDRILENLLHLVKNKYHIYEYRFRHQDGSYRWVHDELRLVCDADDCPCEIIGYWADITDRKQVEQALEQAKNELELRVETRTQELVQTNKQLRREIRDRQKIEETLRQHAIELQQAKDSADAANAAKNEFLASITHEIRTPMNAILGFCEQLQQTIQDPEPQSYLSAISTSGNNLLDLINDILDLSKIDAGKLEVHYEAVNLRLLMGEIRQIFSQKAAKKEIQLCIEIADHVPLGVQFDPIRLRQILFNVVGNAIKFTQKGSVQILVGCQPDQQSSSKINLEIAVDDTGIGISQDQQQRIFEAFTQSQGQNGQEYEGTGLGLAITKRLTHILGGNLNLQSQVGQGSRFTFTFPQINIIKWNPTVVTKTLVDKDLNQFSPLTILVVDDVYSNRFLIRAYFKGSQHQILEAKSGEDAISLTQEHHPDLILLDLRMPIMDGREVTRQLKQDPQTQDIPIIILTAAQREEDDFYDDLWLGWLRKPVKLEQLVAILQKINKEQ